MEKGRKKQETKEPKPRRGRGRPSTYSQDLVEEICLLISEGLSVRKICERDGMPERRTIYRWIAKHDEFRRQYSVACDERADLLFEECLTISDDDSKDYQHRRLMVDTRKWMCGKLAPKKYSDKLFSEIQADLNANVEVDFLKRILGDIDGTSRGLPAVKANSFQSDLI